MRIVLALSADIEDRLLEPLLAAGHELLARPAGSFELIAAMENQQPDAALVAGPVLTPTVLRVAKVGGVRVVAMVGSASDRAFVGSLGVTDVVDSGAEWERIEAALLGTEPRFHELAAAAPPVASGRILAVWGPAGSPGRTTTAIGLAAELASRGERVALVDADTYGGSVAPALGLLDEAPGFAAACRLAGADGLDGSQLDRIAQPYPFGSAVIPVLTGIGRPSRWPELSADRVTTALRRCRGWADTVIVDVGFNLESDEEIVSDLFAPRRNAATLAALAEADLVVAVGAADPIGLARLVRAHVDLLEIVDSDRIRVIVNKVRSSAVGLNPGSQIAASLLRFGGIREATLVPYDSSAYDAALLTGRTVREAAPKSPAVAALAKFVAAELARPEPVVVREVVSRQRRFRSAASA